MKWIRVVNIKYLCTYIQCRQHADSKKSNLKSRSYYGGISDYTFVKITKLKLKKENKMCKYVFTFSVCLWMILPLFYIFLLYITSKAPRLKLKTGADGVAPN